MYWEYLTSGYSERIENKPLTTLSNRTAQIVSFFIYTNCDSLTVTFLSFLNQRAKKVSFTACHSGKLACTNTRVILISPVKVLMSSIDYSSVKWIIQKKFICPSGKLRTEFTILIRESTNPGLSDMTFFAHCKDIITLIFIITQSFIYHCSLYYNT